MGNCQAIDAAALVIQHPSGKIERMYWPILASEVMKINPGHYVSLIIPLPPPVPADDTSDHHNKPVQFTRVKLLRPTDTLALGHAYRLVTTQEVIKVLRAKKHAKMKRQQPDSSEKQVASDSENGSKPVSMYKNKDKDHQATKDERQRPKAPASNSIVMRSKSWRPALQSISEAAS
ncbi:uncharacterized protein [Euphorbia lathyris]|uniref:uncharacterized protein n=1 Tax=Euphorbia lathyris TaxID=212925 RepID=UPI0033131CD7